MAEVPGNYLASALTPGRFPLLEHSPLVVMSRSYRINDPSVVAEIIDGEAIIMNLASGHYFSTRDSGCELWHAIQAGLPLDEAFDLLAARYDATTEQIGAASSGFVASLLDHKLIVERADGDGALAVAAMSSEKATTAFAAPELQVYTDMEELLLLDPIHDVDAAGGWPLPKPVEPSA